MPHRVQISNGFSSGWNERNLVRKRDQLLTQNMPCSISLQMSKTLKQYCINCLPSIREIPALIRWCYCKFLTRDTQTKADATAFINFLGLAWDLPNLLSSWPEVTASQGKRLILVVQRWAACAFPLQSCGERAERSRLVLRMSAGSVFAGAVCSPQQQGNVIM